MVVQKSCYGRPMISILFAGNQNATAYSTIEQYIDQLTNQFVYANRILHLAADFFLLICIFCWLVKQALHLNDDILGHQLMMMVFSCTLFQIMHSKIQCDSEGKPELAFYVNIQFNDFLTKDPIRCHMYLYAIHKLHPCSHYSSKSCYSNHRH